MVEGEDGALDRMEAGKVVRSRWLLAELTMSLDGFDMKYEESIESRMSVRFLARASGSLSLRWGKGRF